MWLGWILHHLVRTMALVNPVFYSWTFLFKLQVVGQTNQKCSVLLLVVLLHDNIALNFFQN